MRHKKNMGPGRAGIVAASALALILWGCGNESGSGRGGRTVSELSTVSCLPENNNEIGGITYSAERLEDGVAYGWICMGDPDAPVTIVEFASLTCPHCATFHNEVLPDIKKQYVETGKVKFAFSNFVFNEYDMAASMVVRCGGSARAFPMLELFFKEQNQWYGQGALDKLAALARRAGLNRVKFDACLKNTELQKHLEDLRKVASGEYAVSSTPTFFINGEEVVGVVPLETFKEVIESKF